MGFISLCITGGSCSHKTNDAKTAFRRSSKRVAVLNNSDEALLVEHSHALCDKRLTFPFDNQLFSLVKDRRWVLTYCK